MRCSPIVWWSEIEALTLKPLCKGSIVIDDFGKIVGNILKENISIYMYLLWFNVIYTLISIKLFNISYVSEYLYKMTSNGPTHIYIWNILILRWKSYKNLKCTHYQSCKISRVHLLHWRNFQSYCKEVSLEVSTTSCDQISSLQDLGNTSESPHTAMIALVLWCWDMSLI